MVQTQYADAGVSGKKDYARLAINYDATLYVCRYQDDNNNDENDCAETTKTGKGCVDWGVPDWLKQGNGWEKSDTRMCGENADSTGNGEAYKCGNKVRFQCYEKFFAATPMNKYGYFETEDAIVLGGNSWSSSGANTFNYFVIAQPVLAGYDLQSKFELWFDGSTFLTVFWQSFFQWLVFTSMVYKFLLAVNFRVDRIDSWLCTLLGL